MNFYWSPLTTLPTLWIKIWFAYLICLFLIRQIAKGDESKGIATHIFPNKTKLLLFLVPCIKVKKFTRYTIFCIVYVQISMALELVLFIVKLMGVNISVQIFWVISTLMFLISILLTFVSGFFIDKMDFKRWRERKKQ